MMMPERPMITDRQMPQELQVRQADETRTLCLEIAQWHKAWHGPPPFRSCADKLCMQGAALLGSIVLDDYAQAHGL